MNIQQSTMKERSSFCKSQLLTLSFSFLSQAVSCTKNITCETIGEAIDYVACEMRSLTVIDKPNFVVTSSNADIDQLLFDHNYRVSLLPVEVKKRFPDLKVISAIACVIVDISKENFEGLSQLREVRLTRNRIEYLPAGIFADLASLKFLKLGKVTMATKSITFYNFISSIRQKFNKSHQ